MSDLHLEDTVFADLKKTFSTISDRMETTRRALRGTDASSVGAGRLVDDMHGFADDWAHGVKQLGKHTHGAVKMIDKISKSFAKLDLDLAESLKMPQKKGK